MKTKSKIKNRPAQMDSGISKLTGGILGILRSLGILGGKTKSENCPVQQGSKISNLVLTPHTLRPLRLNLLSAQRDSGMSKLGTGKQGIFTMRIKNKVRCFMGRWVNESMSEMQNSLPQRHSKMSNMKIEAENSLPQRYSIMSNLDLGNIVTAKCSKNEILTIEVKNNKPSLPLCLCTRGFVVKPPAQQDSGIYKLGVGRMSLTGHMGLIGQKDSPVQRDSKMYNLGMEVMRVMGIMGRRHIIKNGPRSTELRNVYFESGGTLSPQRAQRTDEHR